MKLFVKFLIAAVVLAILLPFTILKDKDGRPLMTLDKIKAPDITLPQLPETIKNTEINSVTDSNDVIYKWRDSKGELHFSSSPPSEGIRYTSKGYDPNTNLIQSVNIPDEKPEQVVEQAPQIKKPSDIGNPYSPEKVEKLMEDAQNIQKLLNDRISKQEALID